MGLGGARIRTEIFGAAPAQTPGYRGGAAPGRRIRPRAGRPTGRVVAFARSGLAVAGIRATPACSSWPRRVTCRCAGRAGPACATPARPACCPARSAMRPIRSSDPADGQRADLLLAAPRRPGPRLVTAQVRCLEPQETSVPLGMAVTRGGGSLVHPPGVSEVRPRVRQRGTRARGAPPSRRHRRRRQPA